MWDKPVSALTIYCDNQPVIFKVDNDNYNGKFRIVCLKHNHMKGLIADGIVTVQYVKSKDNLVDLLSKGLSKELTSSTSREMELESL